MIDPARLRRVHRALVAPRVEKLRERGHDEVADACRAALGRMHAFAEAHRSEIRDGSYGSFGRFIETYGDMLARFEDVLVESFALDAEDPANVLADAERAVAAALPFVESPRAFALRALCGVPPFEPPGPLARRLLDLRTRLADLERWKQREFLEGWRAWGGLVFHMDRQAAELLSAMGDPVPWTELAEAPFAARLERLRAAFARHTSKST